MNPKNNNNSNIHSNKVLVSNTSVIEKPEGITNNEILMGAISAVNPATHSKDKPHGKIAKIHDKKKILNSANVMSLVLLLISFLYC